MKNLWNIITIILCVWLSFGCTDGAQNEKSKEVSFHRVQASSLFPSSSAPCVLSPRASNTKSSLDVAHRYGPCSSLSRKRATTSPDHDDILRLDQARVESIHSKLSKKLTNQDRVSQSHSTDLPARDGSTIGSGNYIVTVGIGTPKHDLSLVFDTGSDLTWTQCEPCGKNGTCYPQEEPIFNPSSSTSYSNVSCSSPVCDSLTSQVQDTRGHYTERAAASVVKTIMEVVQMCHKHGVMHRDLKPENFLFANKKETASLKAIDFGLSVFFKPGAVMRDGREVILQAYNWESHKHDWYKNLDGKVPDIAKSGFTFAWLPPPSQSLAPEGYLPHDLCSLNSAYSSKHLLKSLLRKMKQYKVRAMADILINHRVGTTRVHGGMYNRYDGISLLWGEHAVTSCTGGLGNRRTGDNFNGVPNVNHTQHFVRKDIIGWLRWLRNTVGFQDFRFDFARGTIQHSM